MPLCTFAANKNVSGGAAFWKLTRDNVVMLTVFKQVANNPDKKGNFDLKNGINVKLSNDEVGGIIRAIRTDGAFKFYHEFTKDGNKSVAKGGFSKYSIPAKGEVPERNGFGLSVDKDGTSVKVNYSLDSAELLMEFLKTCVSMISKDIVQEDDDKDKEYLATREQNQKPAQTVAKPTPTKVSAPKKVKAPVQQPIEEEVVEELTESQGEIVEEGW